MATSGPTAVTFGAVSVNDTTQAETLGSVTGTSFAVANNTTYSFNININGHFTDKLQQVLSVYYDDMIQSLVSSLRNAFLVGRNLPKISKPIPLVLSGGTTMPKGFRDRFEKILKESDFPIPLSEIRMAAEPLNTTAKGALVAALCDL